MVNEIDIKVSEVCGICAGCMVAINKTQELLQSKENVTLFKPIVHNKNVNEMLFKAGANSCETLNELLDFNNQKHGNAIVILRAHGEPPSTYNFLKQHSINFVDCTCNNVKKIHEEVAKFSNENYTIILLGKYGKYDGKMHPEILGTIGWCNDKIILVEDVEDINKIRSDNSQKYYLVCQTTFNLNKADLFIEKIQEICKSSGKEIVINKSICMAQKMINIKSFELAKTRDVMIVVGSKTSSNSTELANALSNVCKTIFIEDIYTWKSEFEKQNIQLSSKLKIGLTAGASTLKSELETLKNLITDEIFNKN